MKKVIAQSFVNHDKREDFTIPCSYHQTQEYRLKFLALDHGWEYDVWQIANDINNSGALTRDWKEEEIEKLRESVFQSVLDRIVEQFESTTDIILHSEVQDSIRQFIEKNSRIEHSVVAKNVKRRGMTSARAVIECCIFYEMSLDTVANIANIDLLGSAGPAGIESI